MGALYVQMSGSVQLTATTCCACGVVFGMPASLETALRESHKQFFCVSGHPLRFHGKTEAELAREAADAARAETEKVRRELGRRLNDAQTEANKANAENLRLKRRAKGGLCPCCKRSFVGLSRHIKSKHPTFAGPTP